jgi:hypothetical protein
MLRKKIALLIFFIIPLLTIDHSHSLLKTDFFIEKIHKKILRILPCTVVYILCITFTPYDKCMLSSVFILSYSTVIL